MNLRKNPRNKTAAAPATPAPVQFLPLPLTAQQRDDNAAKAAGANRIIMRLTDLVQRKAVEVKYLRTLGNHSRQYRGDNPAMELAGVYEALAAIGVARENAPADIVAQLERAAAKDPSPAAAGE